MKNTVCNSFYDNGQPTVNPIAVNTLTEPKTVVLNNSTGKKTLDSTPEETIPVTTIPVPAIPKKKSTLWIWAASYLAAILLSPSENLNYKDSSNNLTP